MMSTDGVCSGDTSRVRPESVVSGDRPAPLSFCVPRFTNCLRTGPPILPGLFPRTVDRSFLEGLHCRLTPLSTKGSAMTSLPVSLSSLVVYVSRPLSSLLLLRSPPPLTGLHTPRPHAHLRPGVDDNRQGPCRSPRVLYQELTYLSTLTQTSHPSTVLPRLAKDLALWTGFSTFVVHPSPPGLVPAAGGGGGEGGGGRRSGGRQDARSSDPPSEEGGHLPRT